MNSMKTEEYKQGKLLRYVALAKCQKIHRGERK